MKSFSKKYKFYTIKHIIGYNLQAFVRIEIKRQFILPKTPYVERMKFNFVLTLPYILFFLELLSAAYQ